MSSAHSEVELRLERSHVMPPTERTGSEVCLRSGGSCKAHGGLRTLVAQFGGPSYSNCLHLK